MSSQLPKIAIIGAGPAGTTLSLFLSKKKIPHYLIEKSAFPRDKVCGDGYTTEVLKILGMLNEDWLKEFKTADFIEPIKHVVLENSLKRTLHIDFQKYSENTMPFYAGKRLHFDHWLFNKVDTTYAEVKIGQAVRSIQENDGVSVIVFEDRSTLNVDLVVGADGERSIVRKTFHPEGIKKEKSHSAGGLRQYYKNIDNPFDGGALEFFLLDKKFCGYFWIFHLPNNEANVGIGALGNQPSGQKVKLRELFEKTIKEHPKLKGRFSNATPLESPKGWGLPFNSNAKHYAGKGYALIGDAASMIEPFTGKGIGVSMFVAKYLADVIEDGIAKNDFSEEQMLNYENAVEAKFRKEWKGLERMQSFSNWNYLTAFFQEIVNIKPIRDIIAKKYIKQIEAFVARR